MSCGLFLFVLFVVYNPCVLESTMYIACISSFLRSPINIACFSSFFVSVSVPPSKLLCLGSPIDILCFSCSAANFLLCRLHVIQGLLISFQVHRPVFTVALLTSLFILYTLRILMSTSCSTGGQRASFWSLIHELRPFMWLEQWLPISKLP